MKRLFIDLKEDCHGHLTGPIKLPVDSVFVFECLAEVIKVFAESCEVPPAEIASDLHGYLLKQQDT